MAAGSTGSFFLAKVVMKFLLEKIPVFEYRSPRYVNAKHSDHRRAFQNAHLSFSNLAQDADDLCRIEADINTFHIER